MPTKRLFSDWTKEELEDTFLLSRHRTLTTFDEWIACAATQSIDDVETIIISRLKELLIDHVDAWNETELIEYFIGPMLTFVNFNTPEFSIFSERPLSALVGEYELAGEPDAVIAKGTYSPKVPYFCFHEYKKDNEPKGDPAAQALSAMLAAQALNPRPHPIYGLYVVGKMWYFMLLDNRTYCINAGHNALKDEIFDIFKILKALKALLLDIAQQNA